jgi:hypothetical protein
MPQLRLLWNREENLMLKTSGRKLFIVCTLMALLAVALLACAPKQGAQAPAADSVVADSGTPAVEVPVWSESTDCKSCHPETSTSTNGGVGPEYHTDASCQTCHTDSQDQLTNAHADYSTAKQPTRLRKTTVEDSACTGCHDPQTLIAATAVSTILTDTQGKTVNPHDLPATEKHEQSVNCASCHQMHTTAQAADLSIKTCRSCHHKDVYECHTCHE